MPFKIDAERADGWSAITGEERADGWTYQKVAERMLVDLPPLNYKSVQFDNGRNG